MHAADVQVAVIIPAYNPGEVLVECVDSVLKQTVTAIEIVVVDDGSSEDLLPNLPSDPRLRIIRQANQGVSAARNNGVRATVAHFLAFLDADDRWAPTKLEQQLMAMADAPDAVLCHTGFSYIDLHGNLAAESSKGESGDYLSLLVSNDVMTSSVVVRRHAYERAGGFDSFYSIVADWDLWLRLAMLGRFILIGESLADYRLGPHGIGQLSGDPWMAHLESLSILDRHELLAFRTGNAEALRSARAARGNSTKLRASKAAFMFVDSVLSDEKINWKQLGVAVQISPRHGAVATLSRAGRHFKNRVRRLPALR